MEPLEGIVHVRKRVGSGVERGQRFPVGEDVAPIVRVALDARSYSEVVRVAGEELVGKHVAPAVPLAAVRVNADLLGVCSSVGARVLDV